MNDKKTATYTGGFQRANNGEEIAICHVLHKEAPEPIAKQAEQTDGGNPQKP